MIRLGRFSLISIFCQLVCLAPQAISSRGTSPHQTSPHPQAHPPGLAPSPRLTPWPRPQPQASPPAPGLPPGLTPGPRPPLPQSRPQASPPRPASPCFVCGTLSFLSSALAPAGSETPALASGGDSTEAGGLAACRPHTPTFKTEFSLLDCIYVSAL